MGPNSAAITSGTRTGLLAAVLLVRAAWAEPLIVGDAYPLAIETPRSYAGAAVAGVPEERWSHTIKHEGATYIAIHFVDFELGPGDELIIDDGQGGQRYVLTGRGKMQAGTFWARHVKGDAARLRLMVAGTGGGKGFEIDQYAAGYADISIPEPAAICGTDERENAICYRDSHPIEYERSMAVVRLLIAGRGFCTGSLVSPFSHVLTNNHCIRKPSEALNTDFDFMAEAPTCESPNCSLCWPGEVLSGATLVQTNMGYDYSLVQLHDTTAAERFGYLEFDNRVPVVGEQIYHPQHSAALAKQLGIFSSHPSDTGGVNRINTITAPTCNAFGTTQGQDEVGYFSDSLGGSSGSPVLATATHKLLVLHHCNGCPNRGVAVYRFYREIEPFITGVPPIGGIAPGALSVSADSVLGDQVPDRAIDGQLETLWVSSAGTGPHWLQLDLGLTAPVSGFRVWHASASGAPNSQNARSFVIASAPTASGPWTIEFTGDNTAQEGFSTFAYPALKPLRHVRLLITDAGGADGAARIADFEVFAPDLMVNTLPTGTNVATSAVNVQASSQYGPDTGAANAIDGVISVASRWVSASVSPPHTLTIDLGSVRTVSGFIYRQPSMVESSLFNANAFSLQTARSFAGPWHTEALVLTDGDTHTESRAFVSPKDVRYVRLSIADSGTDAIVRLPEFEVIAAGATQAGFAASPTRGHAPLAVQFVDLSTGAPTTWSWSLGGGASSNQQHPAHVYTTPGSYSVSLTVNGPAGQSSRTVPAYIEVLPPAANFEASPTQGSVPLTVQFTDLSMGQFTSWFWEFGDSATSSSQHPQHTYTAPGLYTVSLSVDGPSGPSNRTRTDYILVKAVKADFDGDGDVDQIDFAHLQRCFGGPGAPVTDPACQNARLDADDDVDGADFDVFQSCMSGPGLLPPPTCPG